MVTMAIATGMVGVAIPTLIPKEAEHYYRQVSSMASIPSNLCRVLIVRYANEGSISIPSEQLYLLYNVALLYSTVLYML